MVKRFKLFETPPSMDNDAIALANWAFNSHNWTEFQPGCFECSWCKKIHYSAAGIGPDFPLCTLNPCISALIMRVVKNIQG